jgi:hypothetical protein
MEVNPEAWPWAPWIGTVRQQPVLIADGSGPVYAGLRLAVPNPYNPSEVTFMEFGKVKTELVGSVNIGHRIAGKAAWNAVNVASEQLQKFKLEWYDASGWPANEEAEVLRDIQTVVDGYTRFGRLRYSAAMPTQMGWNLAPDAWVERIWPQVQVSVYSALRRIWTQTGATHRLPAELNGRLELTHSGRFTVEQLLPPTATGWRQFLMLAPTSGLTFTELETIGAQWWGRRIPRNLLSAARNSENEEEE